MEILWAQGQATADEVRAALGDDSHDSTVRTLLRVLKSKGYLKITRRQPAVFKPSVPRSDVQQSAARSMLNRFFNGAADQLILRLLEDEHLTADRLEELRVQFTSKGRKGNRK